MPTCIFDVPSQNFMKEKEHILSTCSMIPSGLCLYFQEFTGCVLSTDEANN